MNFTWPYALALLALIPILLIIYLLQQRRRRARAVRHPHVALVRAAVPARARWRRHVPVGLFLTALGLLGVASARPTANVTVASDRTSIILALDVSRSMCATDVEPNRLVVAQQAARRFVENQPPGTRIGIVVFAGFAEQVVAPTKDREQLLAAIDALTTARGTAIGAAMLKSIDAISQINPDVPPVGLDYGSGVEIGEAPFSDDAPSDAPAGPREAPAEGYVPDIVVVLTDGANTRGIEPQAASKEAVARRVRVYTIGFGTTDPTAMVCTPQQLGGDVFADGGGFGGGAGGQFDPMGGGPPRQFLVIDEPTLQEVADTTGGQYFRAENADQLTKVFDDLPREVQRQREKREVSMPFAMAGLAAAALAIGLSLRWNPSV
jgi:Ca-activated chloride channel homolog